MNWCGSMFPTTMRRSASSHRRLTETGVPRAVWPSATERRLVVAVVAVDGIAFANRGGQDRAELVLSHRRMRAGGDQKGDRLRRQPERLEPPQQGRQQDGVRHGPGLVVDRNDGSACRERAEADSRPAPPRRPRRDHPQRRPPEARAGGPPVPAGRGGPVPARPCRKAVGRRSLGRGRPSRTAGSASG